MRRLVLALAALTLTAVTLAGCGKSRYEYHLLLPAPPGEVEGADVFVDGKEQGTVESVRALRGSGSRATIGLDDALQQDASIRVCDGELQIDSGRALEPAYDGHVFPQTQAAHAPGSPLCDR